jgi:magnesium-transporting ATPase (P-type)
MQAVEEVVHPMYKEAKNVDGKKPYEIFTENHEELVKAGDKWSKETVTSYIALASIVITIMIAAIFAVWDDDSKKTGSGPISMHHEHLFITFLVEDVLSIITSASSVLIFTRILTSRYSEKDFLIALPLKLLLGLIFLFISICTMMFSFHAALNIILEGHQASSRKYFLGPLFYLGGAPMLFLLLSQLRFIFEILFSTFKNPISSI